MTLMFCGCIEMPCIPGECGDLTYLWMTCLQMIIAVFSMKWNSVFCNHVVMDISRMRAFVMNVDAAFTQDISWGIASPRTRRCAIAPYVSKIEISGPFLV